MSFTDCLHQSPTSWSWNFGESCGFHRAEPEPHLHRAGHVHGGADRQNQYWQNTYSKNNYITVTGRGSPPVANFSGNPTRHGAAVGELHRLCPPIARPPGRGRSGTPSPTSHSPSHTYTSAGSYTVSLMAYNQYGNNTHQGQLHHGHFRAGARWRTSPARPPWARALSVTFTDSSTGLPTSWSWAFGDGGTSTAQNPSHTYTAAGSYTVALTAFNA